MRWPWRRAEPQEPVPSPADEALARSEEQLAAVRRRNERVEREPLHLEDLAARFRRMREENHLAEKFRDALEGH